jgi:hypothetical protein
MERELAMARHEGKEAHRRTEQEQELRRKADQDRAELRKRLDDETNRRTKEQNNSHHVAEKISSLEKERNQVSCSLLLRSSTKFWRMIARSVPDPNPYPPDPHVFGLSGSLSQRYPDPSVIKQK